MNILLLIGLIRNVFASSFIEESYCILNDDGTECLKEETVNTFLSDKWIEMEKELIEKSHNSEKIDEEILAKNLIDKKMPNGLARRDGVKVS